MAVGNQINQHSSSNSVIKDILNFGVELTGALLQGYAKGSNQRFYRQTEMLNGQLASPYATNQTIGNTSRESIKESTDSQCTNDFQCGIGNVCVKQRYRNEGVCMQSVDENGVRTFNIPSAESVGVRTSQGCQFNTDCPARFSCDGVYKVCVKR